MKNVGTIAAIVGLLLSALICAVWAQSEEKQAQQPVIVLEEIVYDLGVIFEGQIYKHAYVVRNEGKADLIIEKVKPG